MVIGGFMTHAAKQRRTRRAYAVPALCGVLLAGCSSSSDGGHPTGPSASPAAVTSPAAQHGTGVATARFTVDPERVPTTPSAALRLVRAITAGPDGYGPGYVKRFPYESDPAAWPVLGTDCVWRQDSLPDDVLATFTRYSRLPAADSKGEVRTAATVTLHRTAAQADQEMAETLEEALRCPDQQLRATERIRGLNSMGSGFGTNGNTSADDYLIEMGTYDDPALGKGATYYLWNQVRLGPVTIAVVVEGGKGFDQSDLLTVQARAVAGMETKVRTELGAQK